MPYEKTADHPRCPASRDIAVVGPEGRVYGCHATEAEANRQIAALYANEEASAVTEMTTETTAIDQATMPGGTLLGQLLLVPPSAPNANYVQTITSNTAKSEDFATITVTTDEEEVPAEEQALPSSWKAILGFEGYPSDGDSGRKRFIMRGALDHRQLPQPFSYQPASDEGHRGKVPAGRIDSVEWIPAADFAEEGFELPPDLPEDAMVILGRGIWDLDGEHGREAARMVTGKFKRGVSLDLAGSVWVPIDPETLEEVDPESLTLEDMLLGSHYAGVKEAMISGATIVDEPSFGWAMVAAGGDPTWTQIVNVYDEPLLACAAGPLKPPAGFFERMKFTKKTPITVTEDGEWFGHIATWDCHMGDDVRCFRAQRSRDGYAHFHTGGMVCEDGSQVRVGRITVKEHASFGASRDEVIAHYSDPKKVGAFVVIWEDEFGIASHGVTRSDAAPELLRDLYANPPSPDWRRGELLGVSTVPLPGLPVVEPLAVMSASAEGLPEVEVLILPALGADDFAEVTEQDALVAAAAFQGDDALLDMIVG